LNPRIATVLFYLLILALFKLDRRANERYSKALWVPIAWLLIGGSRNVGQWLQWDSPMDQGSRYLEGSPLDRAVLATLMALGIIVLLTRQQKVGALLRANSPVLIFLLYCAASCLWSDYPAVALKRWFRAIGDLIMVLVILTDYDWSAALKRVLARVGFLLLPLSVLLIRYYPDLGRGYSIGGGPPFWTGVTTDKNGLGMICLIFGLGAVWRFIDIYQAREDPRRTRSLIARGFLVLITVWLLWESNSMTSISCFAMAIALMIAVGRWPRARKPAIVTILAAGAVGLSAFALFGGGGVLLEALGRNATLTGRTEVWKVLLPLAQSPIVGSGYESFWLGDRLAQIGDQTSVGINEAHNGYLEIYLNLGWMGLILLAFVLVTGYRKILFAVRWDPALGKIRVAYFVLALIYNFTEAAFKMQSPVWILFLIAVMAPNADVSVKSDILDSQAEEHVQDYRLIRSLRNDRTLGSVKGSTLKPVGSDPKKISKRLRSC
jgi:exopolysaccharide production protein ExoQ